MSTTQKKLIAFLDNMERTIIGEEMIDEGCSEILSVKNPVVVNIIPQADPQTGRPTGQMALQLLPVFFKEFLGDKDEPVIYRYCRSRVTRVDFNSGFDFRLYAQYDQIFNPSNIVTPADAGQVTKAELGPPPNTAGNSGPVISLFDK